MGTVNKDNVLSATLFGRTRRAVLSLLFGHADETFSLRDILRVANTGHGAVQRELKALTAAGIVRRQARGRQVYYQANPDLPVFQELQGLVTKTSAPGIKTRTNVRVSSSKLSDLCQRHHIRRLAFFGSVLRDDFRPDSDVDILVEFEPKHVPGFFKLAEIEAGLSSLLDGHKVDLHTPDDLSRYFRDQVVREAEVRYDAKTG